MYVLVRTFDVLNLFECDTDIVNHLCNLRFTVIKLSFGLLKLKCEEVDLNQRT